MHSVKLSIDERDSARSIGGMSESCAVLLLGIEFGVLMYAGWGEVRKSLVVLLLAGEERFERSSRVVSDKSVARLGECVCLMPCGHHCHHGCVCRLHKDGTLNQVIMYVAIAEQTSSQLERFPSPDQ